MKKYTFLSFFFTMIIASCYSQTSTNALYNKKFPLYSYYEYSWSASIYNKAEVAQSEISSITLFFKNEMSATLENCEIYLASTESTTNDLSLLNNAIKVFGGDITFSNAKSATIQFDKTFDFNNENLVVYFVNNSNKAVFPMPEYLSKEGNNRSTIYNYSVFANNTAEVLESNTKPIIIFNSVLSSVEDNRNINNILYPNPVIDILNLNGNISEVKIYNSLGSLVFASTKTSQIDVSTLTKGVYFIEMKQDNILIRKQFIKE